MSMKQELPDCIPKPELGDEYSMVGEMLAVDFNFPNSFSKVNYG